MREKCKNCTHSVTGCHEYLLGLTPEELRRWCEERKHALGYGNQELADVAQVSKRTIDRFFAAQISDIRFSSLRPILNVLTKGFCCLRDTHDCEQQMQELTRRVKSLQNERSFYRKVIAVMGFALTVCIIAICTALVIDAMRGDMGFFWLEG